MNGYLLATEIAKKLGWNSTKGLILPHIPELAKVFISYSWQDSETVNKIDQWLRDRNITVIRDNRDFQPGKQLDKLIKDSISKVDKVVVVYSKKSKNRDWVVFERDSAKQLEGKKGEGFIIYLILDDTPLPVDDPKRLAISATGRKLKDIGEDLFFGITGKRKNKVVFKYDENEIL
ncbi:MAG: toll/interleukin-1 receptor domain-containing protein [Bacteroidota bacterium]